MRLWKLGCRWGSGTPLFYRFIKENNIVIGWIEKDYQVGDWLLITDGHTVLDFAEIKAERKSVLEFPEYKAIFKDHEIPYDQQIFIYDASFIQLKEEDQFTYPLQQGIVNVQGKEYIERFNSIRLKYMKLKSNSEMRQLIEYKKQIILQGPPGTGKTKLAKEISKEIIKDNEISKQTLKIKTLTKEFIKQNLKVGDKVKGKSEKFFTIEKIDKNTVILKSAESKPWRPSYNKIVESFENQFWNKKGRSGGFKPYEDAVAKYFHDNFSNELEEKETVIDQENNYHKLIQFHPSYTYEDFVRGIVSKPNEDGDGVLYEAENRILAEFADRALDDPDNNYVLILDEINRANLSSVLGELIYALEYRGDTVESMYAVNDSNQLILPSNLYIIGTMNTADRSVGHIDYAIRRRFAFVDVLPEDLSSDKKIKFDTSLFIQVKELFTIDDFKTRSIYLSQEFDPKEVTLGHSYFIDRSEDGGPMEVRLKYEIKPILLEYVKDGILIGENIKKKIENLEISI